jgi:hypothetical protein
MWSGHSCPLPLTLILNREFTSPNRPRDRAPLATPLHSLYYSGASIPHGPRKLLGVGVAPLMDSSTDHRTLQERTARQIIWTSNHSFHGWTCSQCEWNSALPTLLNDPAAKTAYDRLAAGKFKDHKCADHLSRLGSADDADSFTPRIRKLVTQGFKPKDAVELFLQEVALEYRNQPKVLAQAKTDAEDFLRRVRAGLI